MRSAREAAEHGTPPNGFASLRANPEGLLTIVLDALDAAKAEDVAYIDLRGKTSIGDYMVIASGRSDRHVGAIAEQLARKLRQTGATAAVRTKGLPAVRLGADRCRRHHRARVPALRCASSTTSEKMWSAERPMERLVI